MLQVLIIHVGLCWRVEHDKANAKMARLGQEDCGGCHDDKVIELGTYQVGIAIESVRLDRLN